ncbi:hypothetical protein GIB67_020997 [Kingdonia uniflora]|uniref:Electron transfer flavoprotein-ubiquinone oxidoreductase n=1 Tax=Kingdonia uniflora TaxID=39325 RepID=A0A7J7N3X4_9MAGN|nr:hypothetical protein GIB67_020997 [Kingdonia uniflora]
MGKKTPKKVKQPPQGERLKTVEDSVALLMESNKELTASNKLMSKQIEAMMVAVMSIPTKNSMYDFENSGRGMEIEGIRGNKESSSTGMLAAEAAFGVLHEGSSMQTYWDELKKSWIWEELNGARNYRPSFDYGLIPGLALSAMEHYILKGRLPLTLKHGKPDHEATDVRNYLFKCHETNGLNFIHPHIGKLFI